MAEWGWKGQRGEIRKVWGAQNLTEEGEMKTGLFKNLPTKWPVGRKEGRGRPLLTFPSSASFSPSAQEPERNLPSLVPPPSFNVLKEIFVNQLRILTSFA